MYICSNLYSLGKSIIIMKWFTFKRYIIHANCSTTTQPITPGQTLNSKPICAPSWQFNHHLQIVLHHRESSSESDFTHMNIMGRKVLGVTPMDFCLPICFQG